MNADSLAKSDYLGHHYSDSELVIGLVAATGTDLGRISDIIGERLSAFNYTAETIRISKEVIPGMFELRATPSDHFASIQELMDLGNEARQKTGDYSILALAVAAHIHSKRRGNGETDQPQPFPRKAFIVRSLKHPEEVKRLREIYSHGFFCIGVHEEKDRRRSHLVEEKRVREDDADKLISRDKEEEADYGQHTSDAFHQSDFFLQVTENEDRNKKSVWRALDIIFGSPYITPNFDEYAMFMAFSSALRSADLSRQVGAVVARDEQILSTGANDVPRYGGGLYWPEYKSDISEYADHEGGRDYKRGQDSNKSEKEKIIKDIVESVSVGGEKELEDALRKSQINELTEYGRAVHAEMEALLACGRSGISTRGATLYCTTFPCHNCAKHIVASGIKRVVFVEPYPKSKAIEFHDDSIELGFSRASEKVVFEPFVGVGPRSFFSLFSVSLGSGYRVRRKDSEGAVVEWEREASKLRMQLLPCSYLEREMVATKFVEEYLERLENE